MRIVELRVRVAAEDAVDVEALRRWVTNDLLDGPWECAAVDVVRDVHVAVPDIDSGDAGEPDTIEDWQQIAYEEFDRPAHVSAAMLGRVVTDNLTEEN